MFKSLKEKLKGWISKNKEEVSQKEQEEIKTLVKTTKKEKKKKEKEKKKDKSKKEKKTSTKEKSEPIDKKPPIKVKPKEKSPIEVKTEEESSIKEKPKPKDKKSPIEVKTEKESPIEDGNSTQERVSPAQQAKPSVQTSGYERFALNENEKSKLSTRNANREQATPAKEEPQEKKGLLSSLFRKKETPTKEPTQDAQEPQKEKPKLSFFQKALTESKFEEIFEELELILLQNNVAYEAIENIKKSLKEKLVGESAKTNIEQALKESIEELLINPPNLIEQIKEKDQKPFIMLFAGINGAGKTTTIAKVANLIQKNNLTVCLASADTFRAAAIEQLSFHADKLKVPLIKKDYGADPASVGFDAIKYAKKNKIDVVLIDTAGRMNNRETLMKEIEKISRVNSPDIKIFLGESITGNDATEQAKDFNNAIGIDGIILSKADVDEKGGTAISVSQVTKKPIYFLGTGQTYDDLELFQKENLIEKIFS